MADPELERELEATLGARRELGDQYDGALASSFLEKLDRDINARVDAALAARSAGAGAGVGAAASRAPHTQGAGLAVASIALGIPVSAVVASNLHGADSLIGVIVAWIAIATINVVHVLERRPAR